tara:strand:+ start:162 stop:548 length:387 start_codon:yes stop_codon:yes gene_type:complete
MAYPTGSGSEVLKRTSIYSQQNTQTAARWDGTTATTGTNTYAVPALHIITVLNIIWSERGSSSVNKGMMWLNDGVNNLYYFTAEAIPEESTFIWNEKIVLIGGDKLLFNCTVAANTEIIINFIDQDWS